MGDPIPDDSRPVNPRSSTRSGRACRKCRLPRSPGPSDPCDKSICFRLASSAYRRNSIGQTGGARSPSKVCVLRCCGYG